MIGEANRVPVSWVREHLKGSDAALLVCAYEDEARCRSLQIPGSILFRELNDRMATLSRDQEIVFYCS